MASLDIGSGREVCVEADSWRVEDIDLLKGRNRNCNAITAEDLPVKPMRAPGAGMALQNSASL